MTFIIQTSQPKNNGEFCKEDKELSEAIETIFPMMTEESLILWNTIYVPLNYKYDVSYIIEDVLHMLRAMREVPTSGELQINWPSNTFSTVWNLIWSEKKLAINSNWYSVLGHTEQLLNKESRIEINLSDFVCE